MVLWAAVALGAEISSEEKFEPRPVAGHPVFDMRVGIDRIDQDHPVICAEAKPLAWLSIEGCGTGSGILHRGDEPDMAHFRARVRAASAHKGRASVDLLPGAGFAEVQRTTDEPGFRFGKARSEEQVEAAGPEASVSVQGRLWLDNGGRTYATADLNAGAALIPAAPTVLERGGPVVPFAAFTVGMGF